MNRAGGRNRKLRTGTAMSEFALALPLLVAVLAILLFMGWSMMRKQRVVVANRYAVWRRIENGSDSGGELTDAQLNRQMLYGAAAAVSQENKPNPDDALRLWSDEAQIEGLGAATLADQLLHDRWPASRQTRLAARYDPPMRIAEQFSNEMSFRHARAGLPWRRGQASVLAALAELYYEDLDGRLIGSDPIPDSMAEDFRSLYYLDW